MKPNLESASIRSSVHGGSSSLCDVALPWSDGSFTAVFPLSPRATSPSSRSPANTQGATLAEARAHLAEAVVSCSRRTGRSPVKASTMPTSFGSAQAARMMPGRLLETVTEQLLRDSGQQLRPSSPRPAAPEILPTAPVLTEADFAAAARGRPGNERS